MHDRLRVDDDLDVVVVDAEQLAGLDYLEPLVHERRGVDRDLRPHLPGRMGEGVGHAHRCEISRFPPPERSPACRDHDSGNLANAATGKALVYRTVLGVDRDELGTRARACALDHRRAGHERFLVREGEPASLPQRGDRHAEARESDDGVQHHVGSFDERGQRTRTCTQLDARRQQIGEPALEGTVGDRDDTGVELFGLGRKKLERSGRPERAHTEAIRGRPEHIEGLGADRASGPHDGDASE